MERCTALDNAHTLEDVVRITTNETALYTSEQIAGWYAFRAATEAGFGYSSDNLMAHLDILNDAGAVFNYSAALEWARLFAA